MSEIEGFCDRCGLLLPEWKGNQRSLCACEKKRYNEYLLAFLETEGEIVRRERAESRMAIRVLGFLVLAGIAVWTGLAAFWFEMWIAGGCLLGSGVLWLCVAFCVLLMGREQPNSEQALGGPRGRP
jgi:hypothetical protein